MIRLLLIFLMMSSTGLSQVSMLSGQDTARRPIIAKYQQYLDKESKEFDVIHGKKNKNKSADDNHFNNGRRCY